MLNDKAKAHSREKSLFCSDREKVHSTFNLFYFYFIHDLAPREKSAFYFLTPFIVPINTYLFIGVFDKNFSYWIS